MAERKPFSSQPGQITNSKRVFRQARASHTARRIIDAANQLLNDNCTLSNEAISEAANVSVSSIYRYFNNRSDLFAEMFRLEADNSFNRIAEEISKLDRDNYKRIIRNIIEASAEAVTGDKKVRRSTFRNIEYEVAQEINIKFNYNLHNKLIEQISLVTNCHSRFVDTNLVMLLARLLVSIPRITVVESIEKFDPGKFFTELTETASDILLRIFARADATHK